MDFNFIEQILLRGNIPESQILEYKPGGYLAEISGNPKILENNKRDLLKRICGFANAAGGFIIYGIKAGEKNHLPEKITGTDVRFEDIVTGQIHRALSPGCDYEIKKLNNPNDPYKPLYILRISESPTPVMVYLKDELGQFYLRRNESTNIATRIEVEMLFAKSANNRKLIHSAQRIYNLLKRYVEYHPKQQSSVLVVLRTLLWLKENCVELGIIPIVDKLAEPVFNCANEKYQIALDGILLMRSEPPVTSLQDHKLGKKMLEDLRNIWREDFLIFIVE